MSLHSTHPLRRPSATHSHASYWQDDSLYQYVPMKFSHMPRFIPSSMPLRFGIIIILLCPRSHSTAIAVLSPSLTFGLCHTFTREPSPQRKIALPYWPSSHQSYPSRTWAFCRADSTCTHMAFRQPYCFPQASISDIGILPQVFYVHQPDLIAGHIASLKCQS